jgi:TATA-binding protein-associated factor Taf7
VTNRRRYNLLRNTTTKADNMKILRCPCCRQINWKHLHNEIVNNMFLDIENNYKRGIATSAEHVFYRNWSSIEKDKDDSYEDNDSDDSDSDDSDDIDEDEYLVQPNDMILNEIKIGDMVKLKTEVGKTIWVIVNEILQNEYIGTINRLTFDLEFKFGDMVSFSKDDIISYKNKSRQE